MDLSGISKDPEKIMTAKKQGMWRWKEFLPVSQSLSLISLGEGDTPLIAGGQVAQDLNLPGLFFKAEFLLPTGSLKDRSVALAVNHALSVSAKTIAVASTGNHAASLAAYAAAAGLKAFIFVPENTDRAKINQAAIHGATVVCVKGTMQDAGKLLHEAIKVYNWYPCMSTNPFRNEGKKTCTYEVWEQLDQQVPDFMVHPIGGGIGLWAAWKAWCELKEIKWTDKIPKMVGAQAVNAAPVGEAWEKGLDDSIKIIPRPTCAESIALGAITPGVGFRTLAALKKSGGTCVNLTDEQILNARDLLARRAGLFVEPAAAASLAAIIELRKKNVIQSHHVVVCLLTGQGLKQTVSNDAEIPVIRIDADLSQLEKILKISEVPS